VTGEGLSARVLELVEELAGDGPGTVEPGVRLADAGIDSLAFAELAAALAAEAGVDLTSADVGPQDRVVDVLRAVEAARARPARPTSPPGMGRLQRPARHLGGRVLRWWFDLRVTGAEHVPASGPAILAMNHESALDIPIAVVASPRPITFMAKRELFKNAFVSWALTGLGGFRVDRGKYDQWAVEAALAALRRGEVLGMYPEGTRAPGTLLPFLPGAAWLALRTGAPLVPCAVAGTEHARSARAPGRVRVRVAFAPPIAVERTEVPHERRRLAPDLTARIREAVVDGLRR
jgi:1-acyl-sn-glycerol-3-phosphate acyltransferase